MGSLHDSTALESLVRNNRLGEASRLLDRDGFALFEREGPACVAHALHAVGVTPEGSSARVLALKALLESNAGRSDTAEAWFHLAIARAEGNTKADLVHRFALDLLKHGRTGALELLLPLADDPNLSGGLRAAVHATLATVHARHSGNPDAKQLPFLQTALRLLESLDDEYLCARIHQQAAFVFLETANLEDAFRYARSGAALAEKHGLHDVLSQAFAVLYRIAIERDELEPALAYLERIRQCAAKMMNRGMELYGLINACEIRAQRGDLDALVELDGALCVLDVRYDDETVSTLLPSQALRAAWQGNFTHAYRLLASTVSRQRGADRQALRAAEIAVYAAAMLDTSAHAAIDEAFSKIETAPHINVRVYRAQCLTALACAIAGDLRHARSLLVRIDSHVAGIRAFKAAVLATIDRFAGVQNHETLYEAYEALRARGYGGYVRLLEALPIASAMQSRFSRLDETDIASLKAYLTCAQIPADTQRLLCEKLECERPAHLLTLAVRYSPYPVPAAAQ